MARARCGSEPRTASSRSTLASGASVATDASQSEGPLRLADNSVMALLYDRDGALWIGTMTGGLERFDPQRGSLRSYRHDATDPTTLPADGVMSLYEDRGGDLWVGTFGGGLARIERGNRATHSLSSRQRRRQRAQQSACERHRRRPARQSLDRHDRRRSQPARPAHRPLPSLSPQRPRSEQPERRHDLRTARGCSRHRVGRHGRRRPRPRDRQLRSARQRYASRAMRGWRTCRAKWCTASSRTIKAACGSARTMAWCVSIRAAARASCCARRTACRPTNSTSTLTIAAATARCTSAATADSTLSSRTLRRRTRRRRAWRSPRWRSSIKSCRCRSCPAPGRPLALAHDDKLVTFEFAALDFISPANNRYLYRLEGFDPDWVDAGRAASSDLHEPGRGRVHLPGARERMRTESGARKI